MKLLDRIYDHFMMTHYQNEEVAPNVDEWITFLNSLPVPSDSIQRAHNKYLCKKKYLSLAIRVLFSTASFGAMIPAFISLALPSLKNNKTALNDRLLLERLNHLDYKDIIPDELRDEYKEIVVADFSKKKFGRLTVEAKHLFSICIREYWFDPLFLFFIYKDLAKHSWLLYKYNPAATALYASEKNVALPVITDLYEMQGRKFISFMHGDYLLQLIQAYMQFSEYYIWDESYKDMFVNILKCEPEQFRIYTPAKLKKKYDFKGIIPEFFCTYYISEENEQALMLLLKIFEKFRNENKKCKIRLHPRWTIHDEFIKTHFKEYYIEDPKYVTLEESLASTEYVVGLASTVLHEASVEGKKIVIDDITAPEKYKSLMDRHYIMLTKEYTLLSELK